MARHVVCLLIGHRVLRDRIRPRGNELIGRCRWCNTRMHRDDRGWKAVRKPG